MELHDNGVFPRRNIFRGQDISFDLLVIDDFVGCLGYVELGVQRGIHLAWISRKPSSRMEGKGSGVPSGILSIGRYRLLLRREIARGTCQTCIFRGLATPLFDIQDLLTLEDTTVQARYIMVAD